MPSTLPSSKPDLEGSSSGVLSFAFPYCSWDSNGKNTRVVCHLILYNDISNTFKHFIDEETHTRDISCPKILWCEAQDSRAYILNHYIVIYCADDSKSSILFQTEFTFFKEIYFYVSKFDASWLVYFTYAFLKKMHLQDVHSVLLFTKYEL